MYLPFVVDIIFYLLPFLVYTIFVNMNVVTINWLIVLFHQVMCDHGFADVVEKEKEVNTNDNIFLDYD